MSWVSGALSSSEKLSSLSPPGPFEAINGRSRAPAAADMIVERPPTSYCSLLLSPLQVLEKRNGYNKVLFRALNLSLKVLGQLDLSWRGLWVTTSWVAPLSKLWVPLDRFKTGLSRNSLRIAPATTAPSPWCCTMTTRRFFTFPFLLEIS